MAVGLYTSRLVLDALGVVDYGVYGLVGGIVTMFAFLNSAMASSTQRYLSYDIGRNDLDRLQKTFNATLNIHFLVAFIILVLAETIGLWFVNYKLYIPGERLIAANWVYQFSIFTFILNIIQVPYNALLIAREHMRVYAYVSIFETILKLIIALILIQSNIDRLIIYSILTFCVSFILRTVYMLYCKNKFTESVYKFFFEPKYYKELLRYSGWNLFGNIAATASIQGSNILLNLFFGPIANAAYSLTLMVQGIIGNFVGNFQMAINPQIVKNYSIGEKLASLNLIYVSAKFSFFVMMILVLPFFLNMDYVINLWLKEVPSYTIDFIKLSLIYSLIETISNPLMTGLQATGKIKIYQIVVGSLLFLNLPVAWILLKETQVAYSFYWSFIIISIASLFLRLYFVQKLMDMTIFSFYKEVLLKILLVVSISIIFFYPIHSYLVEQDDFLSFLFKTVIIIIISIFIIFVFGLNKKEKGFIHNTIRNKIFK
jgi:O-antigen/teichoic acid export membrane protein